MKRNMTLRTGVLLLSVVMLWGCAHGPREYATENYVVVETVRSDTLESLAATYLNDPEKAWVITDFNMIKEIEPGQKIIIPLHPFNLGGVGPGGYQLVSVLSYDHLTPEDTSQGLIPRIGFEQQMAFLKKNDFQVISFSQLMEFLNYTAQIPEKSVVITLNDTSRAMMDLALPVLETYRFPATLFVDPHNLGADNGLTGEDLKILSKKGIDIQCRAGWAIDGDIESQQITLENYFDLMKKEISQAKTMIEDTTGNPCLYYEFPGTGGNNLLVELLRKLGFKAALVINGQANPFYVDHFNIGGITVPPMCSSDDFKHKLTAFRIMGLN